MSKDLTIRILGRPQVTQDDQAGYQRVVRQYVVEGYRVSDAQLNASNNPLILGIGTPDEEFEDHYLVDQKISPKQGSVDVAFLTREFVQVRDTWSSESFSQSRGFKRITRQYVALRAVSDVGYSETAFAKHPKDNPSKEDSPWVYIPLVIENSEPTIAQLIQVPEGIYFNNEFNHKWHRSSVQVNSQQPGIDVWNVSWTAPIRPDGEPTITEDTKNGYQTILRSYVLNGEFYSASKLFFENNPLFLPVSTSDHEYPDHFLVDQQVKPMLNLQKEGDDTTEDLGMLTRKFVKVRGTYTSESVSTTVDLRKITRTYAVLRADHAYGYKTNWNSHPQNSKSKKEPWDYFPDMITDPDAAGYSTAVFDNHLINGKIPTFADIPETEEGQGEPDLRRSSETYRLAGTTFNSGKWLKSNVAVNMEQPGIDIWSVSWVTHNASHITSSPKKIAGGSTTAPPKIVEMSQNGLIVTDIGGGSSNSQYGQMSAEVAYFVDEQIDAAVTSSWGGGSSFTPSVYLDFYIEGYQHSNGFNMTRLIENATYILNTTQPLTWGGVTVGAKSGSSLTFNGDFLKDATFEYDVTKNLGYDEDGNVISGTTIQVTEIDKSKLPIFKGKPIAHAGGHITWTRTAGSGGSSYAALTGVTTIPIASSADPNDPRKIWKVITTYVG